MFVCLQQIKDKLIFEQQKMDAFEQRKARQEQRKYAKELNSNKVAEKSKRKKEGLEEIEQWKKGAKRNRLYFFPFFLLHVVDLVRPQRVLFFQGLARWFYLRVAAIAGLAKFISVCVVARICSVLDRKEVTSLRINRSGRTVAGFAVTLPLPLQPTPLPHFAYCGAAKLSHPSVYSSAAFSVSPSAICCFLLRSYFVFGCCRGGPLADDDGLDAVLAGKKAGGRAGKVYGYITGSQCFVHELLLTRRKLALFWAWSRGNMAFCASCIPSTRLRGVPLSSRQPTKRPPHGHMMFLVVHTYTVCPTSPESRFLNCLPVFFIFVRGIMSGLPPSIPCCAHSCCVPYLPRVNMSDVPPFVSRLHCRVCSKFVVLHTAVCLTV